MPIMAASISYRRLLIVLILGFLTFFDLGQAQNSIKSRCDIHPSYLGTWYSREGGVDIQTIVSPKRWGEYACLERYIHHSDNDANEGVNSTMLVRKVDGSDNCFICVDVLWRTPNVLQYRMSGCFTNSRTTVANCDGKTNLPTAKQVFTMFKMDELKDVNCISTWEGMYRFTYEVDVGGGICDSPDNILRACQNPGSSYVDNRVFFMTFARCPGVQTSFAQTIRYQCMGTWYAKIGGLGYTFAAIAHSVEKDNREKFKCLMTLKNQKQADNSIRWIMSRFADCDSLNSLYEGPFRIVLHRIPPPTTYITPQCNLPRNISGLWFTQGIQFTSQVSINDSHIHYFTQKTEFVFEDTFLSCQQSLGTRFLMTKYIVGKCEVDFVCYDIMPRHHGIVRYRVGKPSRLTFDEEADPKFMVKKFREVCSWQSFTFNRNDTDWKYEVLILDPPSPVNCPLGGRYSFEQNTNGILERYSTKIRGVTPRPRVQINCRVIDSEFKSCTRDATRIEIDEEYCESVDYRGRPIGEYDEPDHILTCVGYWMEDMKSYLITYDEEDAISRFRCWVYERTSWTAVSMSRSQTARCKREQTSTSYLEEGTGLWLDLYESERLFDDCPQRFDPGIDPYSKSKVIYVLSSAPTLLSLPTVLMVTVILLSLSLFHDL